MSVDFKYVPVQEKGSFSFAPTVNKGKYLLNLDEECPILCDSFREIINEQFEKGLPYLVALANDQLRCEFYDGLTLWNWSQLSDGELKLPTTNENIKKIFYFSITKAKENTFTFLTTQKDALAAPGWSDCFDKWLLLTKKQTSQRVIRIGNHLLKHSIKEFAITFFEKSLQLGSHKVRVDLALLKARSGNKIEAIHLLLEGVKVDHVPSMTCYAHLLTVGKLLKQNLEEAERIYRILLNRQEKLSETAFCLGKLILNHHPERKEEALELLRYSADLGDERAMYHFGRELCRKNCIDERT